MQHYDQSCDCANHWTSVACISILSGSLATSLVCLLRACCRTCFAYVRRLSDRRACVSWLSSGHHQTRCYRAICVVLDGLGVAVLGMSRVLRRAGCHARNLVESLTAVCVLQD